MHTTNIRVVLDRFLKASRDTDREDNDESGNRVNLAKRIADLAVAWPESDIQVHDTLDQICRKLSVTKRLETAYDGNWKNIGGSELLGADSLYLLTAVLLAYSHSKGDSDASYGRTLKYFNAALGLSAIAARADHGELPKELRDWCRSILEEIETLVVRGSNP